MALFRKSKDEGDSAQASADNAWPKRVPAYVPASAQSPELQRFGSFDDPEDGPDEDVEFLASLARSIDTPSTPQKPVSRPIVSRVQAAPNTDDLHVFRELASTPERTSHVVAARVADVDLGVLLDELATTAAALRRKRAA